MKKTSGWLLQFCPTHAVHTEFLTFDSEQDIRRSLECENVAVAPQCLSVEGVKLQLHVNADLLYPPADVDVAFFHFREHRAIRFYGPIIVTLAPEETCKSLLRVLPDELEVRKLLSLAGIASRVQFH